MRTGFLLSFALLLTGCGVTVVDGITVKKDDYELVRERLVTVASNDLACPRMEIATKVLRVNVHAMVIRIAVSGCGKDVIYARTEDDFAIETAPPPER